MNNMNCDMTKRFIHLCEKSTDDAGRFSLLHLQNGINEPGLPYIQGKNFYLSEPCSAITKSSDIGAASDTNGYTHEFNAHDFGTVEYIQ